MSRTSNFSSALGSLWFRLITLAIVALLFSEAFFLSAGKAQGWTFYLTAGEVTFEVAVRLVAAALAGLALGSIGTAAVAPFLWHFQSSRELLVDRATKIAVVLVIFLVSRSALKDLIHLWAPDRGPRFTTALLTAHFLAFAVALCIPRARKEMVASFDLVLGERVTRRTAMATVVGAAALVATEFVFSRTSPAVKAALGSPQPKSNFLLITFDALNAEDLSLYGRTLPTTPNIDAFARKGTVFTNFYSGSTFTTPSIATILMGMYPSECHVHQLTGLIRADAEQSLPHLMRAAGYATGAFISNPAAYYLAKTLENGFEVLPEPIFQQGGVQHLWDAIGPLHQDSGFGSRFDEYHDFERAWNFRSKKYDPPFRFRPNATFEQARQVLAKLPDGFFLWVHVMAPHEPYLPDPVDRGRFIPDDELRTFQEDTGQHLKPFYGLDRQSQVDRRRLGYDEYVASADRTFGAFISELENVGRLRNTTVIVSADHGESFEGGVYQHGQPFQTRPTIHVPLIVRTSGQQDSRKVAFTADQTSLAPTILELAGLPRPESMRSPSLVDWLNRDGQGEGEGLAFTQHLQRNSVFKPLRRGTVGVIDGRYQYVLDLTKPQGILRLLPEAQMWNIDRSAEHPERAQALRAAIFSRFPELVQKPS